MLKHEAKIKRLLIERIREHGFPIGVQREFADSTHGILAVSDREFYPLGGYGYEGLLVDGILEPIRLSSLSEEGLMLLSTGKINKDNLEETRCDLEDGGYSLDDIFDDTEERKGISIENTSSIIKNIRENKKQGR